RNILMAPRRTAAARAILRSRSGARACMLVPTDLSAEETKMADTPTFGRYAEIPYDQMTPEQQDAYRSLIETRGRLLGPNKIYVHNPKLANVMGPLGAYFRTGYSLSEREREIAVCIINSKWHSAYPTNAHERAGKAAGLPDDKVE